MFFFSFLFLLFCCILISVAESPPPPPPPSSRPARRSAVDYHISLLFMFIICRLPLRMDGWMDFSFFSSSSFFFKGITGVVWAREHSEETWGFIMCSCLRLTNSETKRLGSFSWLFFFSSFHSPPWEKRSTSLPKRNRREKKRKRWGDER